MAYTRSMKITIKGKGKNVEEEVVRLANHFESRLIKRTYRISGTDDKMVKKNAKKFGGESEYIRKLIREGIILKVTSLV